METKARAPDGDKMKNQLVINFLIRNKMKRLFLLSILALLFKWGVAQEYETIVDTTKQWAVVQYWFYDDWPVEDRFAAFTTGYRFRGDTLINNYHYKFLEECKDSVFENWYRSEFLMRDDSAGRVYIHDYNIEKVLYDFNVKAKDTIWIPNPYDFNSQGEMEIVDSVGVEFIAGKERRVVYWWGLVLSSEGFGTDRGPLGMMYHFNVANCSWYVTCFKQNNEMLYQSEDSCFIHFDYTSISDLKDELDVHIYPNPVSKLLKVELSSSPNASLSFSLFTLEGKKILVRILNEKLNTIDLENIQNGMYLMQLKSVNGQMSTQKLIIKK
jgi:hypothetical protein